jgi:hypothetical protein
MKLVNALSSSFHLSQLLIAEEKQTLTVEMEHEVKMLL